MSDAKYSVFVIYDFKLYTVFENVIARNEYQR